MGGVSLPVPALGDLYSLALAAPRRSKSGSVRTQPRNRNDWMMVDFFVYNYSVPTAGSVRFEGRLWPFVQEPQLFLDHLYTYTHDVLHASSLKEGAGGVFQGCVRPLQYPVTMCDIRCDKRESAACEASLLAKGAAAARKMCPPNQSAVEGPRPDPVLDAYLVGRRPRSTSGRGSVAWQRGFGKVGLADIVRPPARAAARLTIRRYGGTLYDD